MSLRDIVSRISWSARAACASATGVTRRRIEAADGRAAVLMYHRIVSDDHDTRGIEPGMYVRAAAFERQIAWLQQHWKIRTLGQALGDAPRPGAPPVAVLTFDDGWRDNLTIAWPIMQRYGVRATIFVVGDWIETGRGPNGEAFMRPSDVRRLAAEGIEFGAHTMTHPRLEGLDRATVEAELRASKKVVEQWTGTVCRLFAYPFGAFDAASHAAAGAIFEASVRVGGGWWGPGDDPSLIPRVGVHQDVSWTDAVFALRVMGALRCAS